jgi:hypothetical protein
MPTKFFLKSKGAVSPETLLQDTDLATLWDNLRIEGLLPIVFYDVPNLEEDAFIKLMKQSLNHPFLIYDAYNMSSPCNGQAAAFWLNNFKGSAAMFHFLFLREYNSFRYEIGAAVMEFLFRESQITSLYGFTPKPYRHVFPYMKEIGFTPVAALPGGIHMYYHGKLKRCEGVISVYNPQKTPPELNQYLKWRF